MSNNIAKIIEHTYTIDAKVAEIVMNSNVSKFHLITIRFISRGGSTCFQVKDELVGVILNETILYASVSIPKKVLAAIIAILKFYGAELTKPDEKLVLDLAKNCVCYAESMYGSNAKDFDVFNADAVLFVSNRNVYNPINGMIEYNVK